MTTTESVSQSVQQETARKRRLISQSLWPRARLIVEILYHQIDHDRTFTQAAALTYKTLFSLLPVFVLSLLILSTISSGDGQNALDATVKNVIFHQLSLDKLIVRDANNEPVLKGESMDPVTAQELVSPLIDKARKAVNARATGLIAFAVLLYGALSLMIVIEGTFNFIYGAVKPRSWPRRLMLYWCVLTLGPIGIAASIVLGQSASSTATTLAGAWMHAPLQILAGFFLAWLSFMLMFKLIPDTRVRWNAALLGSFVAAILWELGKWGFNVYIQEALKTSWYGSLVLIPLFMLWIYLTWTAILLGLQVAYMHQFFPLLQRRYFFTRMGATVISDVHWVLALGILLYKRFEAGKGLHPYEAAELLMLPNETAIQLLDGLEAAGVIHSTRHDTYALARDPRSVTAHDLLIAARALCQAPPELSKGNPAAHTYPTSHALRQLEELESHWARNHTLPQLAGEA